MSLCCVPIEHMHGLWPLVRPFIVRALDRDKVGRYLPDDVLSGLLGATLRLWISWNDEKAEVEAAGVTEIINYPRARELRLWLASGDNMQAWGKPLADLLEQYARDMKCDVMVGGDRRGWIRVAGPGWEQTGYTFEKRL